MVWSRDQVGCRLCSSQALMTLASRSMCAFACFLGLLHKSNQWTLLLAMMGVTHAEQSFLAQVTFRLRKCVGQLFSGIEHSITESQPLRERSCGETDGCLSCLSVPLSVPTARGCQAVGTDYRPLAAAGMHMHMTWQGLAAAGWQGAWAKVEEVTHCWGCWTCSPASARSPHWASQTSAEAAGSLWLKSQSYTL